MAFPADTEGAKLKGTAVLLEQKLTGTSVRATTAAWQNPDVQLLSVIEESQNLLQQGFYSADRKLKCSETLMQVLLTTMEVKLGVEQNYLHFFFIFLRVFSISLITFSFPLLSLKVVLRWLFPCPA